MPFFSVNGFTGGSLNGRGVVASGFDLRNSSSGNVSSCGVAVCVTAGIGFSSTRGGGAGGCVSVVVTGGAGVVVEGLGPHEITIAAATSRARFISHLQRGW